MERRGSVPINAEGEHPHGLSEREFDSLSKTDKPVIFNFHAYASLIHKFTYRRKNHDNFHVRGYKEKGNINTPLELAILNQVDRFVLVHFVPCTLKGSSHRLDSPSTPYKYSVAKLGSPVCNEIPIGIDSGFKNLRGRIPNITANMSAGDNCRNFETLIGGLLEKPPDISLELWHPIGRQ